MKKKSPGHRGTTLPPPSPPSSVVNDKVLYDIHKKILASSALNGGFDTLLYKIDKIEQGQSQVSTKVDKIHEAIYDPGEGIFAKLAEHKLENFQKLSDLEQDLVALEQWKKQKEKQDDKEGNEADENSDKIVMLEKSVESLTKSKTFAWSALKWLAVALGGGLITLVFEFIRTKLK